MNENKTEKIYKREDVKVVSCRVTQEQRDKLKMLALMHNTTIQDLLHGTIREIIKDFF